MGDPVVTYVARNLEPHRGFHQFMRALPGVLEQNPSCHVVVMGGDGVSYGHRPDDAANWREKLLRENPMDASRVHFLGRVGYGTYRKFLQISKVHVYLTYPFVLSWSLLEAMACGCHVIGSDTAPVREVITDGKNGELVDFFNPHEIADAACRALTRKTNRSELRRQALQTAMKYSSEEGVRAYMHMVSAVAGVMKIDQCHCHLKEVAV
ncbi:glycosyltransferase [Rhodanobacter glycinis]|uniref:glycosyltransferase n=1 Tax=Rhodanobacter glycinis TaxID=582702 RepID=UPI001C316A5D|nr:glycosyltransferase [Rhodanobacter glycinis]